MTVRRVLDVSWRVLVVALLYSVVQLPLALLQAPRPGLSPAFVQTVALVPITGAVYALVMLPLARRLPCRTLVRIACLFVPLYWIALLSNLVEAFFDTTLPRAELAGGAVVLAIPTLVAAAAIAWLLPAHVRETPAPGLRASLGDRTLLSWVWRILAAGVLFAVLLQAFGELWSPIIGRYYHDPAFMAQTHTVAPPGYVAWPEETARGVVFVLVLLPLLAVMRGRDWRGLLAVGACVALIDAALEGWLGMASQVTWPLQFRLGEGLDLTSDAIARGVFVAVLLALPAAASVREPRGAAAVETAATTTP